MAGEWIETTVGQQATLQRGIDITKAEQTPGTVPVISSGGISSYHDKPAASGPGVVLGRKGVVGSVYYIASDYWPHDTTLWVKDFHGNDPRFVYYFFRWMAPTIATMDVGSANPTLNRNHVHPIVVRWPLVSEQRAIANILGTLDDKIELNHQMSETLEAMARALFRSWFVDYEPVRAKAEGRDPGLPTHLAGLFPDSFEESELGEIPKGWVVSTIAEVANCAKGRSYKSEELTDSHTALVTLKSFLRGGGYRPDGLKPYVGAFKSEQIVHPGDLILACTDVTQAAEIVGRPALIRSTERFTTLVASLDVLVVRPRFGTPGLPFLYCLLRSEDFTTHAYGHTSGTTVLHLSAAAVPSYSFVLPPQQLGQRFDCVAGPLFKKLDVDESQSTTLAGLRDTLLPKLISGELRVRDAEKVVEATL